MAAEQEITSRIRRYGRITFAEFMELALFWPNGGYYSDPDNIGPMGDFYTAPSAHPAFGALLCVQVYQMWRLLDSPATFWVVEMGGGSGLLCRDLAGYAPHLPHGFADSLRYLCLERLVSHGIEGHLPAESRTRVQRLAADAVPLQGITGCFLSNELLDSFPVHRVVARDGSLKEIYVTVEDGRLKEVLDSPSTAALEERLQRLGMSLQEGNTAEINLAIQPWLEQVSSAMERGFIITIDYGHLAPEIYSHRRRRGTLACFHKHTETNDPYRHIGKQDMTAHVDFYDLDRGRSEPRPGVPGLHHSARVPW